MDRQICPKEIPKQESDFGIRMLLMKGCMSPESLRTFELSSSLGKESSLVFSCFETMLAELTFLPSPPLDGFRVFRFIFI
ncbi:hypothetical protein NC653_039893 [Populus alba x Populus x berolinensis]|uniref:Uncharacterized protein n=1 Tax=Populus alba x Populus x berolinensis TaxID=444605 RepID=A0AAD6LCB3_9ROSI|nr:hypothetical protein NC653_039889 [Populus alba x Populus x berolinensis]KAJ6958070.1 hypothetical protein NC653_039890 [Populus alba x Populus x berolinensis]KAJ6958072.1 hypothetical protein NC653_039891 [Populus alba x Populus x berolinensis]KAJ6958074.1 hypothetical protein NC653_039893 [Populus alba x Populus x berolinensis]